MTIPQASNNYAIAVGTSPSTVPAISGRNPAPTDTKGPNGPFQIGQRWINTAKNLTFTLTSFVSFNGIILSVWTLEGGGPNMTLSTLTGNTGGPVFPLAGNINIEGEFLYSVNGSGSTLTISPTVGGYPITPFVVGPVGQAGYQTIQSALDAANAAGGGVLYIYGSYTENLTLYNNVAMVGLDGNVDNNHCAITGVHTPPTGSGCCSFLNINFYGTDVQFASNAAGQSYMVFITCNFQNTAPGYIFNLPNWTGPTGGRVPTGTVGLALDNCGDLSTADSGTVYNPNGGMPVAFTSNYLGGGTGGTMPMVTSGQLQITLSDIYCPVHITGGTGNLIENCDLHGFGVTTSGSSTGYIANTYFDTLTSSAFTMSSSGAWKIATCGINTSGNPAINGSGSGILSLSGVDFIGNENIANTLNLDPNCGTASGSLIARGNLSFQAPGNKITSTSVATTTIGGSNSIGSVTLVGGTATISTTSVTANSLIYIWRQSIGATGAAATGNLSIGTITPSSSFVINSVQPANATALQASDVSVIGWMIVN